MAGPDDALLALVERLSDTDPRAPLLDRLCAAAAAVLGMDGGSITLGDGSAFRATLCATDATARRLEEVQNTLGEGPTFEAHETSRVVDEPGTGLTNRWPALAHDIDEVLGSLPHVVSVPIGPAGARLGVLSLHAATSPTPPVDAGRARRLAEVIGHAVLREWDQAADVRGTWATRDLVDQATGMIIAQLRLGPADAVAVLRAHAFATGAPLKRVADAVVRRELDFTHPGQDTGAGTGDDHD